MMEEYFVVLYYNGEYLILDHEAGKYEDCVDFINEWAEQELAQNGKEVYNYNAEQDKHYCYWKIEKRFRMKEVK